MPAESAKDYIEKQCGLGLSDGEIKAKLTTAGWTKEHLKPCNHGPGCL